MSIVIPEPAVRERIHAIWDALADFNAAKVDEALAFLQTKLCELLNAQNAEWVSMVRSCSNCSEDLTGGWRTPAISLLHPNEKYLAALQERSRELERGIINDMLFGVINMSGDFRSCRLCDVMLGEWFDSPGYHDYYLNCGYPDAVYAAFPLGYDTESWFGLFRAAGWPPFTVEERDTLAYALRGIKWFHRQLLLSYGLLVASSTPLTSVERQILRGLMTGLSEKDIAAAQSQSFHTTHDYIRSIFRKFGVNNRSALMAMWLGNSVRQ